MDCNVKYRGTHVKYRGTHTAEGMHKLPKGPLGKALREARLAAGKEPYECSAYLGLSDKSYISKVERGEKSIDALHLVTLAGLFGVPAGAFLVYSDSLHGEDPDAFAAARLFVEQQVMALGTGRYESQSQAVNSIRSIARGFRPVGLTYTEWYIERHFPEYAIYDGVPVPQQARSGAS